MPPKVRRKTFGGISSTKRYRPIYFISEKLFGVIGGTHWESLVSEQGLFATGYWWAGGLLHSFLAWYY